MNRITMTYQQISKTRKAEADRIVKKSHLLEKLSQLGPVSITGSYKYDLMYDPDIDVIVETVDPRESAHKALNLFFEAKYFRKLEIGDFENFPKANRPHSYIVVLKTTHNDVDWEIEIWFHKSYPNEMKELDVLMERVSEVDRDTILQLKHQRSLEGETKSNLSSVEIYRKVLQNKSQ